MPRKGMKSICFSPKTTSFAASPVHPSPFEASFSTLRRSFTESMIEHAIGNATSIIMKWNPDSTTIAGVTSLFHDSKTEAMLFLKRVTDLHKAMRMIVVQDSANENLIMAQNLMQIAMKRLEKEFYQILSMNKAHLDPQSVSTTTRSSRASVRSSTSEYPEDSQEGDARAAGDSISEVEQVSTIAMSDLRVIAECMIASGYAKECVDAYRIIRKSIIDEGMYKMGVVKLSSSQINKMTWQSLDMKIKSWLEAVKISMRTLFTGERILSDHVFSVSDSIRESVFTDISKEGASLLFRFPELVAKTKKFKFKSSATEKTFRLLDMYAAISENWMEIESIFSLELSSTVLSHALASLVKLSESIHSSFSDFESIIQKDSSKKAAHDGGVHRLTHYAMDYLTLLGDYSHVLTDMISDWPAPAKSSAPRSYFDSPDPDDTPASAISVRFMSLFLDLLCKLDGKAKRYKDVAMRYLFLGNNLQHMVSKVRTSSNIQYLLGEEWISKHEAKVRQFTANYVRLAWGPVIESLPEINSTAMISPEEAKKTFRRFNYSFEEAYKKQAACVVSDPKLRDEIKVSLARKMIPLYRVFYEKHGITLGSREKSFRGVFVRYAPEDIGNYLSDLFFETIDHLGSSPSTSSSSSYSYSSYRRQHRP